MKFLLSTICILFITLTSYAQSEDYKVVVGVQAGYSLTGTVVKALAEGGGLNSDVNASAIPALQLSVDYGLSKVVSLGIAYSYQTISIDATNFSYTDENGDARTETFKTSFNRSQIALRALFHYGNVDKLDMYSGIRIGALSRGFKNFEGENADDLDESVFDETTDVLSGTRFSGAITAFGLRYYFTENIGAGFEINLGAPYIANIGVSGRF